MSQTTPSLSNPTKSSSAAILDWLYPVKKLKAPANVKSDLVASSFLLYSTLLSIAKISLKQFLTKKSNDPSISSSLLGLLISLVEYWD